jgi:hypothetical protein
MTKLDDNRLAAFVDGELPATEAAEIDALLAGDPNLKARAENLRALKARLKRAYDPIADEPVPARLVAALEEEGSSVVSLRRKTSLRWGAPHFSAMAASLAAGVVVAISLAPRDGGYVMEQNGALIASAALDRALTTEASAGEGEIVIGLTFKDADDRWCRTFAADSLAGLACREDDKWAIKSVIASDKARPSGDYRMAASPTDPEILRAVEDRIAGEPLDSEEEAAAIAGGWKE